MQHLLQVRRAGLPGDMHRQRFAGKQAIEDRLRIVDREVVAPDRGEDIHALDRGIPLLREEINMNQGPILRGDLLMQGYGDLRDGRESRKTRRQRRECDREEECRDYRTSLCHLTTSSGR